MKTHEWNLTPEEAIALQREMAARVVRVNAFDPDAVRTIAGVDASQKEGGRAAIVVLSYPELEPLDQATATIPFTFPYIPGLLSFRETPLVLAAYEQLSVKPDLLMFDGQGIAHPRRFGIACHAGLLLDRPTIGCAKSVLTGRFENLAEEAGSRAPLVHRGETIGMALRSRVRCNPLIVSIGHRIDLPTSARFVQDCLRGYRLPETTRAAHRASGSTN